MSYERCFEIREDFWQGVYEFPKASAFLNTKNFDNSTTGVLLADDEIMLADDSPSYVDWRPIVVDDRPRASHAITFCAFFIDEYAPGYHIRIDHWFRSYVIAAPHVAFAIPLLIPPAIALRRSVRKRSRAKAGACLTCGYDLRASKEICPECGTRFVA